MLKILIRHTKKRRQQFMLRNCTISRNFFYLTLFTPSKHGNFQVHQNLHATFRWNTKSMLQIFSLFSKKASNSVSIVSIVCAFSCINFKVFITSTTGTMWKFKNFSVPQTLMELGCLVRGSKFSKIDFT